MPGTDVADALCLCVLFLGMSNLYLLTLLKLHSDLGRMGLEPVPAKKLIEVSCLLAKLAFGHLISTSLRRFASRFGNISAAL